MRVETERENAGAVAVQSSGPRRNDMTVQIVCVHCGEVKVIPRSYFVRRRRHFCSVDCSGKGRRSDNTSKPPRLTSYDRFWAKVDVLGPDDCWSWNGSADSRGYGHAWFQGKSMYAHRISYQLEHGDIPAQEDGSPSLVCHHCDNPNCVNPSHLFVGSHIDNAKDRDAKGRGAYQKARGAA